MNKRTRMNLSLCIVIFSDNTSPFNGSCFITEHLQKLQFSEEKMYIQFTLQRNLANE